MEGRKMKARVLHRVSDSPRWGITRVVRWPRLYLSAQDIAAFIAGFTLSDGEVEAGRGRV